MLSRVLIFFVDVRVGVELVLRDGQHPIVGVGLGEVDAVPLHG